MKNDFIKIIKNFLKNIYIFLNYLKFLLIFLKFYFFLNLAIRSMEVWKWRSDMSKMRGSPQKLKSHENGGIKIELVDGDQPVEPEDIKDIKPVLPLTPLVTVGLKN